MGTDSEREPANVTDAHEAAVQEVAADMMKARDVILKRGTLDEAVEWAYKLFKKGTYRIVTDLWSSLVTYCYEKLADEEDGLSGLPFIGELSLILAVDAFEGYAYGGERQYDFWNRMLPYVETEEDMEGLVPAHYSVKPFADTLLMGAEGVKSNPYRAIRWLIVAANHGEEGAAEELEKLFKSSLNCRIFITNLILSEDMQKSLTGFKKIIESNPSDRYPYCLETAYGAEKAFDEYWDICAQNKIFKELFPNTPYKTEEENVFSSCSMYARMEREREEAERKGGKSTASPETEARKDPAPVKEETPPDPRDISAQIITIVLLAVFLGGGLLYRYTQTHYLDISFFLTIIYRVISVIMILGGGIGGFLFVGAEVTNGGGIGTIAGGAAGIWAAIRMFKVWDDQKGFMFLVTAAAIGAVLMLIVMVIKKVRPLKDT